MLEMLEYSGHPVHTPSGQEKHGSVQTTAMPVFELLKRLVSTRIPA